MRQWLDEVVPVVERPAGGPYAHRVDLTDAFLLFEDKDRREKLIPIESVEITYWVTESTQNVEIDATSVVSYVLKDFVTGEVEHFKREE